MNNQGPPDGPVFNTFHLTQNINVRVIISRKIHLMQRIVFLFGPAALREILETSDFGRCPLCPPSASRLPLQLRTSCPVNNVRNSCGQTTNSGRCSAVRRMSWICLMSVSLVSDAAMACVGAQRLYSHEEMRAHLASSQNPQVPHL